MDWLVTISAEEAMAAARAYAEAHGRIAWRQDSQATERITFAGRDLWRVTADNALAPGEPDWSFEFDGGQSYLIDAVSGQCVGIGLLNGDVLFGVSDGNAGKR